MMQTVRQRTLLDVGVLRIVGVPALPFLAPTDRVPYAERMTSGQPGERMAEMIVKTCREGRALGPLLSVDAQIFPSFPTLSAAS
jgi:hypothetical protein